MERRLKCHSFATNLLKNGGPHRSGCVHGVPRVDWAEAKEVRVVLGAAELFLFVV